MSSICLGDDLEATSVPQPRQRRFKATDLSSPRGPHVLLL
jgi:hypothetical protein